MPKDTEVYKFHLHSKSCLPRQASSYLRFTAPAVFGSQLLYYISINLARCQVFFLLFFTFFTHVCEKFISSIQTIYIPFDPPQHSPISVSHHILSPFCSVCTIRFHGILRHLSLLNIPF